MNWRVNGSWAEGSTKKSCILPHTPCLEEPSTVEIGSMDFAVWVSSEVQGAYSLRRSQPRASSFVVSSFLAF